MLSKRISSKKGFTMVELVIVITILAILSVVGVQQVGNILARSRATADIKNAETIGHCIEQAIAAEQIRMNGNDMASTVFTTSPATLVANVLTGNATSSMTFQTASTATMAATPNPTAYLNAIPTPRANATAAFSVGITQNGAVTVSNGAQQLYPRPTAAMAAPYNVLN